MPQKAALTLDNPVFAGRLKTYRQRAAVPVKPRGRTVHLRKNIAVDTWIDVYASIPQQPVSVNSESIKQETADSKEKHSDKKPIISAEELSGRLRSQMQHSNTATASTKPKNTRHTSAQLSQQHDKTLAMFTTQALKSHMRTKLNIANTDKSMPKKTKKDTRFTIKPFNRRRATSFALIGMAVVLFLFGSGVALQSFLLNKKFKDAQVSAQTNDGVTQNNGPDETRPTEGDIRSYTVAPNMPRYIKIPKFDVFSRVRAVGTGTDGKLTAPSNVYDAGWYKDSAKPGGPGGASLMAGHVSGWTQKGAFYRLKELVPGDKIIVERGDGIEISYSVISTQVYDVDNVDMTRAMLPVTQGKHGLNIISCTGNYNAEKDDYDQRIIVFTEAD